MIKFAPALIALALGLYFGLQQSGLNPFSSPPPASITDITLCLNSKF